MHVHDPVKQKELSKMVQEFQAFDHDNLSTIDLTATMAAAACDAWAAEFELPKAKAVNQDGKKGHGENMVCPSRSEPHKFNEKTGTRPLETMLRHGNRMEMRFLPETIELTPEQFESIYGKQNRFPSDRETTKPDSETTKPLESKPSLIEQLLQKELSPGSVRDIIQSMINKK